MLNRWSWTQLCCVWGESLNLVVRMAPQYEVSTWLEFLIPVTCLAELAALKFTKGLYDFWLGKSKTRVKQLERPAGFAQHQVHGAGGDVKPHFSPPENGYSVGKSPANWALLILELRAKGNQTPAAVIIETFKETQKTSLAFLAHISVIISINCCVILFTDWAPLERTKTLSYLKFKSL